MATDLEWPVFARLWQSTLYFSNFVFVNVELIDVLLEHQLQPGGECFDVVVLLEVLCAFATILVQLF